METAKAVPNTTPNTKFTKGIFGLQNDFGDDFGDRQSVDPPMSDEYVAHFGSVDAELSGPRILLILTPVYGKAYWACKYGWFRLQNDFGDRQST